MVPQKDQKRGSSDKRGRIVEKLLGVIAMIQTLLAAVLGFLNWKKSQELKEERLKRVEAENKTAVAELDLKRKLNEESARRMSDEEATDAVNDVLSGVRPNGSSDSEGH